MEREYRKVGLIFMKNEDAGASLPAATPPGQGSRRSLGRHLGLGLGGAVENSFQNAPLALANPIFNVGLGVSPVLVGFAMAFPRIWEMLIDPLIGTVSDKTRSRFGRRLPYMFFGLGGSLLFFVALWWAPGGLSREALGIWLIVTAFLFYTCYSFFAIPYAALTIEATEAGPDRIGVMTARAAFANTSNILIQWLYWFCQREWFSSPVVGMRWVGLAFGVLITLAGATVIVTTLRQGNRLPASHAASAPATKGSYRRLLRFPPTRYIMVALLSTMVGFTLVAHLGFYLVAFHACEGDLKKASLVVAVKATVATIAAVLACPLVGAAAKFFGKSRVFNVLIALGVLSSISMWWLITPVNPYLSIVGDLGIALCLAGFWLLMPTFLGDISDHYEAKTGESCQGALSALYGVAVKAGASFALLLTGYVLVVCGFSAEMPQEAMTGPLIGMRVLFAILPGLGLICSFFAMAAFRRAFVRSEALAG
jgi:GPH family glycoside/pentoside/hexuronide:cation symporter